MARPSKYSEELRDRAVRMVAEERNSQDLWIGVSRDLLITSDLVA